MMFVAPVLTPVLAAALATFLARDLVRDRWLYFIVALLLVAGVQSILRFLVDYWPMIQGNAVLEQRAGQDWDETVAQVEAAAFKAGCLSLIAAAVSAPLLRYLASNLSR